MFFSGLVAMENGSYGFGFIWKRKGTGRGVAFRAITAYAGGV